MTRQLRGAGFVISLGFIAVVGCTYSAKSTSNPSTTGGGSASTVTAKPEDQSSRDSATDGVPSGRTDGEPGGEGSKTDAAIEAKLVDFSGYRAAVARHAGKVVVVDAWATWCSPCVKNFPHLVELHRNKGAQGVACISLSLDYLGDESMPPDAKLPEIVSFLTKQGAAFDNLVATESLTDLADPEKLGVSQIPAVFVFDRKGKQVKTFTSDADLPADKMYAAVERLVDELLTQ